MPSLEPSPLVSRPTNATPILGRLGSLETRLMRDQEELAEVQRLRYRVFFKNCSVAAHHGQNQQQRDEDGFDPHCDHLLVLDSGEIVGTYRLLPQEKTVSSGGYYSQAEFNLNPLLKANKELKFLELGRSCISPEYRNKRTLELLWHGTWSYALQNRSDILFGCASFPGTDPSKFARAFAWLSGNACLAESENCPANGADKVRLDQFELSNQSAKEALHEMPPLLKGYLRLGVKVSREAVIDHHFGTTDVLVVLKVADINPRYIAHYGPDASRYAP